MGDHGQTLLPLDFFGQNFEYNFFVDFFKEINFIFSTLNNAFYNINICLHL